MECTIFVHAFLVAIPFIFSSMIARSLEAKFLCCREEVESVSVMLYGWVLSTITSCM